MYNSNPIFVISQLQQYVKENELLKETIDKNKYTIEKKNNEIKELTDKLEISLEKEKGLRSNLAISYSCPQLSEEEKEKLKVFSCMLQNVNLNMIPEEKIDELAELRRIKFGIRKESEGYPNIVANAENNYENRKHEKRLKEIKTRCNTDIDLILNESKIIWKVMLDNENDIVDNARKAIFTRMTKINKDVTKIVKE